MIFGAGLFAAAIAGGLFLAGGKGDDVTRQDLDRMNASWNAALQSRVSLPAVEAGDLTQAIATINLTGKQKSDLETELQAGRVSLVWITLWDSKTEDGDVASLESDGLKITVPLLKAKTRIAVPRPAGGVINLTGVHDGEGGGVTVALLSAGQEVLVPPLSVGQTVGIPVR